MAVLLLRLGLLGMDCYTTNNGGRRPTSAAQRKFCPTSTDTRPEAMAERARRSFNPMPWLATFEAAVASLSRDLQRLLEVAERFFLPALLVVQVAQVAQDSAFQAAVGNLARDGQGLVEARQRLVHAAGLAQ